MSLQPITLACGPAREPSSFASSGTVVHEHFSKVSAAPVAS